MTEVELPGTGSVILDGGAQRRRVNEQNAV
jgi:hypothetical protein